MKKKVYSFFVLMISLTVFSQKVKLKGDFVYVNDNKCMKFSSKNMGESNTFSSLEGQKLFYIDAKQNNRNETFYKIQFVGSDDIITLQESSISARKEFITNLIEENVINSTDCTIQLANLKSFKDRYHKDFSDSDTTIIINQTQSVSAPKKGISIGIGR
ncbi:hypothetical protein [Epilithonimonas sp.]|uniref:hypothetical protein n=1 Tax=Epilithonimonas sp. TaxID=2894511 RepID=UPI0035B3D511